MTLVILEGENKTGKTTLATKLVNDFDFKYIKCSQPKGDPYIEYQKILKKIKGNTVIDRFLYGEQVYGPLYRGKSMINDKQLRNIEAQMKDKNAIIIYCSDSVKNIAERFDLEGEEFADKKKIGKALKLYSKVLKKSKLKIYRHVMLTKKDYLTGDGLEKIIKKYAKA